jgi:hypothetical protein
MGNIDQFKQYLEDGQVFKKDYLVLGAGILDGTAVPLAQVKVPLKTMNRHGLIAGATGTGKTKTLQVIAEQLSLKGIPSVLMDLKGDLSGLAKPGESSDFIASRSATIGVEYTPQGLPVELMSISSEKGVRLKATVSEFGPVLLSQILELNDTQQGVVALVFRYCDTHHLPLSPMRASRQSRENLVKCPPHRSIQSCAKSSNSNNREQSVSLESCRSMWRTLYESKTEKA